MRNQNRNIKAINIKYRLASNTYSPESPRWNSLADQDGDNYVGIKDIIICKSVRF